MAFRLEQAFRLAPPHRHIGVQRRHLSANIDRFRNERTGQRFAPKFRRDYHTFLAKILTVAGLDLTEINQETGWFFDPDGPKHVSGNVARSLWTMIRRHSIVPSQGKALRKALKEKFEELTWDARARGTAEPKRLEGRHIRQIAKEMDEGVIQLRHYMSPAVLTSRVGRGFRYGRYRRVPR
ncbi:MAG: hypothetical protein LQ340_006510 [Diploschistes diacapsis]|nr:MAG: hypothetical protein LQ340_006510 [Diploschistes diacapsis]